MNNTLKYFLVTITLSLPLFCHADNDSTENKTPKQSAENQQSISIENSIAKNALMSRLSGFNHFSAIFSQQVIDEEKNILQEGQGKLAVKKPNLVYWETQQPEESIIVSDGQTLWFFDPFIEQATAYRVDASVANTPILLLTSSDETLWQQYSVTQSSSNNFLIHANDINSRVKTLELNFLADSAVLESFSILDSTGQLSLIKLGDVIINEEIASSLFQFTLPEGVYLDDQR
ncbi:MAG: outer membrane lipoprotein chaperone LolA [Thalassotalea sp.]|nr:outer membrane lipoprotein chaperone LolA [Thalassotalea sp.]